jgi:hypothetical protein
MSTNSMIAIRNLNGTVRAIYCHWDGYPEHNGKILVNHYSDVNRVNALLDLGDISFLGPELGEKHDFDSPDRTVVTAYGRDREEDDTEAREYEDLVTAVKRAGQEYNYLFADNDWYLVKKDGSLTQVRALLHGMTN